MAVRFGYQETPLSSAKLNSALDEIQDQVTVNAAAVLALADEIPNADDIVAIINGAEGLELHGTLEGTVSDAVQATRLTTARTFTLSGDAAGSASFDGSANASIALTLTSVATAGTFTKVVVDDKGRVTTGTTMTSGDVTMALGMMPVAATGTIAAATLAANATKLATARTIATSGDATGSVTFDGAANRTIPLTLATVNTSPGTYTNIVVDGKGRVTTGRSLSPADVSTVLGYVPAEASATVVSATAVTVGLAHRNKIITLTTGASLTINWGDITDGMTFVVVNTTGAALTPTVTNFTASTFTSPLGTKIASNGTAWFVATSPDEGVTKVLRAIGDITT